MQLQKQLKNRTTKSTEKLNRFASIPVVHGVSESNSIGVALKPPHI